MLFSRLRKSYSWLRVAPNSGRWFSLVILEVVVQASAAAPSPTAVGESDYLSDQPELILASNQSWGELGWDSAAHAGDKPGEPLRIGEHSFAKGLGHHANGVITVLLDGNFSAFDAEIGLHPCGAGGSVTFRVVVDGEPRFQSRILRSGDAPVPVHVPVADAMELRLETTDAGDGISCDMANWANARLTHSAKPVAIAEDQQVDMGRFGRVVTWDPNRSDGARADRIQEFRAEDLFLDRDLAPDANGGFVVPVATNQLACVGLQWLDQRAVREARLAFTEAAQVPPTNAIRVEGWFGESAWQGAFKPLAGNLERVGAELVFHVGPRAGQGGWLQTRKLRWIFPAPNGAPVVLRPQAYTRTRWAVTRLVVQSAVPDHPETAEVEIVNGEWLSPTNATKRRWARNAPLPLEVRYARLSPLKSDPTVLQFRLPGGAFGVAVTDVLRHGPVFLPDYGLLITTNSSPATIAEAQRKVGASQTILAQVRRLPDQTLTQAMAKTHHSAQREGPVMLSLSCDNAKFVIERDGRVRFHSAIVTDPDWFKDAGEMRPEFGDGPPESITRQLANGWLPSPVTTTLNTGVAYAERLFVAPYAASSGRAGSGQRGSVCVAEFRLTNEEGKESPVRLALNFLVNSREKLPATISQIPQGWLVTDKQGPLALITDFTGTNRNLTASTEGGRFLLAGALPPRGTARCVVILRARDEDLTAPPSFENLLAAFESHWLAALAPAMQIETPDPLLNDIVRSSQIRCLIAARNEADGQRIAAWIAAMAYGPLESEAHSVIRGMMYFGHEDFARRSLDFFIHRYNPNGFLTTGYTTFGTAWHLWTVGEYYQLFHDQAWLRAAAPELTRVGDWIGRQMDKTMQPAGAGRPEFGLMPPGVLADWNAFAYHFANNGYYYAALRELGAMLTDIHAARGAVFSEQAQRLRANTLRAYRWTQARSPAVALRNGAWTPYYPSQVHSPGRLGDFFPGQDAGRSWCYDVEIGAHQLVPTGVLEADRPGVERMLEHMEDVQFLADGWFDYPAATNQADWFNLGGFSKVQPYYTRNAEIYALRDDVKPFLRSYFNSLAAMLNPEVLTLWEHFNHSGAWDKTHETGYFLHQTRVMLVQERGDELWLAPLSPCAWLQDGLSVGVSNAPTRFGRVSYRLTSQVQNGFIEARLEPPTRSTPKAIVLRLRHPDGKPFRAVTVNGQPHGDFDPEREIIRMGPGLATPISVRANY